MAAMPETRVELDAIIQDAISVVFGSITQRQDNQDEALADAVRMMRQELTATAAGVEHQIPDAITAAQELNRQEIAKVSEAIATAEARIKAQSAHLQDLCAGLTQQVQGIAEQQSASTQEGEGRGSATEVPRRVPFVSFMNMPGASPSAAQAGMPAAAPTTSTPQQQDQQQTQQPQRPYYPQQQQQQQQQGNTYGYDGVGTTGVRQTGPDLLGPDGPSGGATTGSGPGFAGGADPWMPGFASGRTEEFDMFSPPRPGGGRDPKEHLVRMPEIVSSALRHCCQRTTTRIGASHSRWRLTTIGPASKKFFERPS